MADPAALAALRESVDAYHRWRQPNTRAVDLTGANLVGMNLTGAFFRNANLAGAYLNRANLTNADLCGANLERARLTNANLTSAALMGAKLQRADLNGATLYEAAIGSGKSTDWVDWSGADFTQASLVGATLYNVRSMRSVNFKWTNLRDADLSRSEPTYVDLTTCTLYRVTVTQAKLADATLPSTTPEQQAWSWNPQYPPTWPRGFTVPANAWAMDPPAARGST